MQFVENTLAILAFLGVFKKAPSFSSTPFIQQPRNVPADVPGDRDSRILIFGMKSQICSVDERSLFSRFIII